MKSAFPAIVSKQEFQRVRKSPAICDRCTATGQRKFSPVSTVPAAGRNSSPPANGSSLRLLWMSLPALWPAQPALNLFFGCNSSGVRLLAAAPGTLVTSNPFAARPERQFTLPGSCRSTHDPHPATCCCPHTRCRLSNRLQTALSAATPPPSISAERCGDSLLITGLVRGKQIAGQNPPPGGSRRVVDLTAVDPLFESSRRIEASSGGAPNPRYKQSCGDVN